MEHRGASADAFSCCEYASGDGSGVMTHVPWALIKRDFPSVEEARTGVGMLFMPNDDALEA